ncbi:MAG: hypothetical protein AAFY72_09535 [Cyanobacteria bacterium J06649_4]
MKQFVTMIIVMALVVGCTTTSPSTQDSQPIPQTSTESIISEESDATATSPTTENSSTPTEPMAQDTLSPDLQQALLEEVGKQQNVSADQLEVTSATAADWPDACLGLAGPDEMCAQMITPGWAVSVSDGSQTWQY